MTHWMEGDRPTKNGKGCEYGTTLHNPYEPPRDLDSSHCSAVWGFREWIIMAVLFGLAVYGGVTILKDTGVIVWHGSEPQFWFNERLRRLIHG